MMRDVTREEFEQFILAYARPLDRDVAHFSEPAVVTFNDFSLGAWPESIVARHTFASPGSLVPTGWRVKEKA